MTRELDDPWFQPTEDADPPAHRPGRVASVAALVTDALAVLSISGLLALAGVGVVTVLFSP